MASGLYDLVFDPTGAAGAGPVGVMLDRKTTASGTEGAQVDGLYGPAEATDQGIQQTAPVLQKDFSGGALYSKRVIENGYRYTMPGYARSPLGVTPPGEQTPMTLPSPSPALGAITESWQFEPDGDLFMLAGRYVLVLSAGTGSPEIAQDLGVGFVGDGAAVFNGDAYIGGSGGNIWKCTAGGVFSQSSDVEHRKAAVVTWLIPSEGLMRARLVMANADLTGIRYTGGDPMVLANWTPNPDSIDVGDSSYQITSIVAGPSHFWMPKTDGGLYDLNSRGETPNLLPDLPRGVVSEYNGAAAVYHNSFVHLGHANGAHRADVSAAKRQYGAVWTLPPFGVPNRTPINGPVTAWALEQGWILAGVHNPALNTWYLGAGRNRGEPGVPDGPGAMLWHFAEAYGNGKVTHLRPALVDGEPRVWIASRQGVNTRLVWQHSPNAMDPLTNLDSDTSFRFGSTVVMYTTPYDWGDPDAVKILRVIGLRADRLGASVSVAVSANAEDGTFTVQEEAARTSPRTRISPRAPLTQGHEIGVLLVGDGTGANPPVIRALKLDAEIVTEQFDRRYYPFRAAKDMPLRGGKKEAARGSVQFRDIANLHKVGLMELRDNIEGETLNVRVLPVRKYVRREEATLDGYAFTGVLPVTVLDIVEGSAVAGEQWGSGVKWGQTGLKYGGAA